MPAPSWENLDEFLDTDDQGGFAVLIVITFQDNTTRDVNGIFNNPWENAKSSGEYQFDSDLPHAICKETDLVGVSRGCFALVGAKRVSGALVGGVTYDVMTGPQSNGTGFAMLEMRGQTGAYIP